MSTARARIEQTPRAAIETRDVFYWQSTPHLFVPPVPLTAGARITVRAHSLCGVCNLPFNHSIHDGPDSAKAAEMSRQSIAGDTSDAAPELSDRMMTCAACSRIFEVDDDGDLPFHRRRVPFQRAAQTCPGSYTKGYPHRFLPEGRGFSFIEFVEPDDDANDTTRFVDRNMRAMAESIHFLNAWLSPQGMQTDVDSLIRVAGHANNVQHAALRLMNAPATARADGQRRAAK